MQAPALNPDVLDYIMAFSNKKALLNTMLASRDLHRGGIKHLLRDVPRLRNTDQIKCFLVFCDARGQVAETAYRMNYLRGLDLDLGSGYRDKMLQPTLGLTSQALTQFFTSTVRVYAHNFARLTIFRCGDLFDGDLALPLTISSLTTLTYLHLGDATKGSFSLLTSLQSRLVEVNIGMNIDLYEPPGIDITSLLRHSGSSMTIISLYYTSSPTGVACYPLVHTLDACRLHMPTTRHYVTTFPNLQVLNASQCLGRHLEDEEKWTRRRNLNISQQAQAGSWRSLRGYVGSILFLYLLGLACHVTYVSVHDFDYEVMDFGQVWAVVADTQPEHLEIHASTVFSVLDQAADIIALCSSPEFQSLKTFKLGLSLCPGDHNTDMEAMLVSIFHVCPLCRRVVRPFHKTDTCSRSASSPQYPQVLLSSDSRWTLKAGSVDVGVGVIVRCWAGA
ncbi:hypothetical protein LXA43DRAFT_88846 [Ganoderma leucocontextum]|nr:hypothetical protein LXA43DRAFT_88846 [Ganoderma leucocontextum]